MFSRRESASRGELAWIVDIEPSCPVFIACSMSKASGPRTSPTMMRSGRMRSALRTSSRCGDMADAFDIGGARLHLHDMRLLQPQFDGVFDRDDALVGIDVAAISRSAMSSCRSRCRPRSGC